VRSSRDGKRDSLARIRYQYLPDHLIGEILAKRWVDNAVPFTLMSGGLVALGIFNPSFFSPTSLVEIGQQISEIGLIVIGMTVVMLSGGIDLSVGMIFALSSLVMLVSLNVWQLPLSLALSATLLVGASCGAMNGVLIGYLRLRAFLTTLVMMIIYRSVYELVFPMISSQVVTGSNDSAVWEEFSSGAVLGLPYSISLFALAALAWHIVLSRSRPGWHLTAVGGARRSAYNAGIDVRKTLFLAYVASGMMCSLSAVLFAARVGSIGSDTGIGTEIAVLTAVVLGGNSLGGGRGSVPKALMGTVIFMVLNNILIKLAIRGPTAALILGVVLLAGVFIDAKWQKHRDKLLHKLYASPAYLKLGECPRTDPGSVFAVNDALNNAELVGLGIIEGPEDPLIDRDDNVYAGSRHGDVYRFIAPDYKRYEIFAHIGGHPIGMNFDRDGNLVVCVSGAGLYMVTPKREVVLLTNETNRSVFSIVDDSRMRLADDLDFAPDGRIFFSEATIRYEHVDWHLDAVECRGNGRLICYDPRTKMTKTVLRNLIFPNGVCVMRDRVSLLFAETWACRISRYWFEGPKRGKVEVVLSNLPGLPDNINRASDGNYWTTLVGMRSPALDLANTLPDFRKRMARRMGSANWMMPNLNTGCVLKFAEDGTVLQSLWDEKGVNFPMVCSVKEHKGYLYLGGINNNRIGKWKIPGADPHWTGPDSYWGAAT
jgi:ribose transport system permease protein